MVELQNGVMSLLVYTHTHGQKSNFYWTVWPQILYGPGLGCDFKRNLLTTVIGHENLYLLEMNCTHFTSGNNLNVTTTTILKVPKKKE